MPGKRDDLIEEEEALLEALAGPDQELIADGVIDPEERSQILYLAMLMSIMSEPPTPTPRRP